MVLERCDELATPDGVLSAWDEGEFFAGASVEGIAEIDISLLSCKAAVLSQSMNPQTDAQPPSAPIRSPSPDLLPFLPCLPHQP